MPVARSKCDTEITCSLQSSTQHALHSELRQLLLLQALPAPAEHSTSGHCETGNQSKQMSLISVIALELVITSEFLRRVVHRMMVRIWLMGIFPLRKILQVRTSSLCTTKVSTGKRHFRKPCDKQQTCPNINLMQPSARDVSNGNCNRKNNK